MRPDASVESHHFEALGTSCSLFAVGQPHGRLLEGESWVRRLGARPTRFSEDSELSRLNRAAGDWAPISGEMDEILHAALRAHAMRAGLVNVAVLPADGGGAATSPRARWGGGGGRGKPPAHVWGGGRPGRRDEAVTGGEAPPH